MNAIEQLQQALGIEKPTAKVMRVVSVSNGMARIEADGIAVVVAGSWSVGTRLVVRAGNVESVVAESATVLFID